MKKVVIPLLALSFFCKPLLAQNKPSYDKFKEYIQSAYDAHRFQGAVLVAKEGEIIYKDAIGLCHFERNQECDVNTRFPILSITKTFTAAVILDLMEEGQLSLDMPISTWLPDFPNGENIEIKHLLTHSSGIFNYTDAIDIEDSIYTNQPTDKISWYDFIKENSGNEGPYKYSVYNNSGFYLLGMIIEKITGKPYETVVRERIFEPLGMVHSGFDYLGLPDSLTATGLQFWTDSTKTAYHFFDSTYAYSAGSIYSTVDDLYQWGLALSDHKILNKKTWDAALKRQLTQFGYAWRLGKYFDHKYVRHPGGYPGYSSEFIYYPKEKVLIILLSNYGNYGIDCWPIAMGLSSLALDEPYDLWVPVKDLPLTKEQLENWVGMYTYKGKKADLSLQNDHELMLTIQGLPPFRLYAQSENVFLVKTFNTKLIFDENKVIFHEHGEETEWQKKDSNHSSY